MKFDTKFHKKNYHSRRVRTQKKVCQELFFNSRKFSIILEKFHFSISKLFHFTFTSRSRISSHFNFSISISSNYFHLHFLKKVNGIFSSLLDSPKPTLAGHCEAGLTVILNYSQNPLLSFGGIGHMSHDLYTQQVTPKNEAIEGDLASST